MSYKAKLSESFAEVPLSLLTDVVQMGHRPRGLSVDARLWLVESYKRFFNRSLKKTHYFHSLSSFLYSQANEVRQFDGNKGLSAFFKSMGAEHALLSALASNRAATAWEAVSSIQEALFEAPQQCTEHFRSYWHNQAVPLFRKSIRNDWLADFQTDQLLKQLGEPGV